MANLNFFLIDNGKQILFDSKLLLYKKSHC